MRRSVNPVIMLARWELLVLFQDFIAHESGGNMHATH